MRILLASLLLIAGIGFVHASIIQNENHISFDDILLLANAKVSDKTILLYIETDKLDFRPSVAEIEKLIAAGVGESVIQMLLRKTAAANDDSTEKPADTEKTVIYVDPYPAYYYDPFYYSGASFYVGFAGFPHSWFAPHFTHVAHHNWGGHNRVGHNASGLHSTYSSAYGSHILAAPRTQSLHRQRSNLHNNSSSSNDRQVSGNAGVSHRNNNRHRTIRHTNSSAASHRGHNNGGSADHSTNSGGHKSSGFGGHSGGNGRHQGKH